MRVQINHMRSSQQRKLLKFIPI